MKLKNVQVVILAVVAAIVSGPGFAHDGPEQAERHSSQADRDWHEVSREHERQEAERSREEMRDKTHDNRVKLGSDTSVGPTKDGINVIITFP